MTTTTEKPTGQSEPYMLEKYTELTAVDVYDKGRVREIVDAIEKEALSFALTPNTNKGRNEIASLAHKVARSKTFLDNLGKDRVSEWKEKAKKVDAERKLLRDRLDDLKDRVRQPLTEWEQKEQERKDALARRLERIRETTTAGFDPLQGPAGYPSSDEIASRLARVKDVNPDDFDEFKDTAETTIEHVTESLTIALAARRDYDHQQEELARLKKEEEERKLREAEEAKKREEAERKRAEKERKEREEREAKEREARIREEEQKRAREAAEKAKREAEERLKEAEQARIRAEERAKAEQEAAIRRERERLAEEKRKEEEAQAKREANKRHRNRVLKEAKEDLKNATEQDGATAEMVLKAIEAGKIRHISITF